MRCVLSITKGKPAAAERDAKRRQEELSGTFEAIRWQNPEGSFIIATLTTGQSIKGNAKPGAFIRGCEYIFSGKWQPASGKYGPTFQFTNYRAKDPVTPEAVTGYLEKHLAGSGAGIGFVGISKLIKQYGAANVLLTIKTSPKDVAAFLGLTYEKAELAAETLRKIEKFENTRMMLTQLFDGRGFPQATIEACIDTFGVSAHEAVKRDPFTMLVRGFHGCGFLRVNALYESLGLPIAKLKRQVICMWWLLTEGNGSVWYDSEWCRQELTRLISTDVKFSKAVKLGLRAKWLSSHRDEDGKLWLAARSHSACETELADAIAGFLGGAVWMSVLETNPFTL